MYKNIPYKRSLSQLFRDIAHRKSYLTKFDNYISFSQKILSYHFGNLRIPDDLARMNAINKLLRILSLNIQDNIICHVLNNEYNYVFEPILTKDSLYCCKCHQSLNFLAGISRPGSPIAFDLSMNPVISPCWNIDRLICALGNISPYIGCPFSFDKMNHFSSILIKPVNLLIIGNGFHSTTSGIYDTNAIYFPECIWDISNWYDIIYFDGIAFYHSKCNALLYSPEQKEIGIIYEIGRLLLDNNLNLVNLHNSRL